MRQCGDGISFRNYIGLVNGEPQYRAKWWGEGKQPVSDCDIGSDRLVSNDNEPYTRFDVGGDRYDPWKPGYNEVFSPYSSPNTNTWSNENSGIFIYYPTYGGSSPTQTATLKIYKAGSGSGTLPLDSILHLTPPSRPMGLRVMPCDSLPVSGDYKLIKIVWNHNQEPDMRRPVEGDSVKRYIIYRNYTDNLSIVPDDALAYSESHYTKIDSVDVLVGDLPEFTDTLKSICTVPPVHGEPWSPFPVRYRVQAVDKYDDVSVLSDFANTQAWKVIPLVGGYEEEGRPSLSEDPAIPDEFDLKQNYPNPFNPVTNIQYDLPFDNFVSIKIYDVLGKEVMTLINEMKNAGRYIVSFNASNLSSGIYYYKIKAGNYESIKKMMLIK